MQFYTLRNVVLRGEWNNECKVNRLGDTFISTHVKLTFKGAKTCPQMQDNENILASKQN